MTIKFGLIMILLCCAGVTIFSGVTTVAQAEVIDKILAFLDEDLILLSEVREFATKPINRIVANLDRSSDVDRNALEYLIEQRLLQREIKYLAFPKERELVISLVMQYMSTTYHDGDMQGSEQQLQAQGITQSVLETELELYMKGVDYIRRKYRFNSDNSDPQIVLNLFQQWVKDITAKAEIHTTF